MVTIDLTLQFPDAKVAQRFARWCAENPDNPEPLVLMERVILRQFGMGFDADEVILELDGNVGDLVNDCDIAAGQQDEAMAQLGTCLICAASVAEHDEVALRNCLQLATRRERV